MDAVKSIDGSSSSSTGDSSSSSSSSVIPKHKGFVDVHAHLIHEKFAGVEDAVAIKCRDFGMEYVIVNGLNPPSNRAVLELCSRHAPYLLPAAGIYPLDAACNAIDDTNWISTDFPPPEKFDVDAEIAYIDELAAAGAIVAIGECGIDRHYLTDERSIQEQERVLRLLMRVAVKRDLPLILHTRKAERRVLDMLQEEGVTRADFHCFCGKSKLGLQIAEAGYYLSIPSNVINPNSQSFRKLAAVLPMDRILTETDSPYMGPVRGVDNDPTTVIESIDVLAQIRGISSEEMKAQVRRNFQTLFQL